MTSISPCSAHFRSILAVLLLAPVACTMAPGVPADANRNRDTPNIVLIMADDQGWGDVAYSGHPVLKTPHLDEMSRVGLRFDHFYAAAPVCSPTRASVLTGRHPNRMGCFKWGHTLRPQEITIAEALKSAGYVTGHFGKWHLGSVRTGSPVNPGASGFDHWLSAPNFYDNDPILSREGRAVQIRGESSIVAADAAIEFIDAQRDTDKPFFAVVWFGSPHGPHRAVAADKAHYEDQGKNADWLGEITGLDRAVGKIRAALRKRSIHQNTLVWYCSDNGGLKTQSSGGRAKKGSIYEGGLRVPGIIEWPARIKDPNITRFPANTADIYPTLLQIAGVKIDKQPALDGISLVPVIEGRMKSRPKPMGFWSYPAGGVSTPSAKWMAELLAAQEAGDPVGDKSKLRLDAASLEKQYPEDEYPGHSAWLDYPWKLHRIGKGNKTKYELYNLADDPAEEKNVAAGHADRVKTMQAGLQKWLTSVVQSMNGRDY